MKIRLPIALTIVSFFFVPNATHSIYAQSQTPKPTYRVALSVSSEDKTAKDEIVSYIARELRSIGDIVIADTGYDFKVSIVHMTVENMAKIQTGHVLSIVVTSHMTPYEAKLFTKGCEDEGFLSKYISVLGFPEKQDIGTTSLEGLEKMCKGTVADIDGSVFEKKRKEHQKFLDSLNKPTPAISSPKKP